MQPTIKTVRVIANPIAGSGRGEAKAGALAAELERAGLSVELLLTGARGDAERFAAQSQADALVSVGGDGTLSEVLRGHREPERPVGILPLGTANVLALDLGLSADPRKAAQMIAAGHTLGLDTARVNGRLAFLVAGVGFDGEVVRQVEARRRGPITKFSYVRAGLATLRRYREPRLSVEIDGVRVSGSFGWVLVSNVVHYGGVFHLAGDRVLDDGLWEVYLFERATLRHLAWIGVRGLLGRLHARGIQRHRARRVAVRSDVPVATQLDGDGLGVTPLDLEVNGPRFRIFCPGPQPERR